MSEDPRVAEVRRELAEGWGVGNLRTAGLLAAYDELAGENLTNAELTRILITKHGVDRYPSPELNALKVFEEAGEMVRHILRGEPAGDELADTVISLYALADKLGLDLDAEIVTKVDGETRSFA